MVPHDVIAAILTTAVHAPSGDNSQPWRFSVAEGTLHIFNVPERDTTLYNFRQRGSFFAHGALLENIAIIAPRYGYAAGIAVAVESHDPHQTAAVSFEPCEPHEETLYPFIALRSTNRKPYEMKPLFAAHRDELLQTQRETGAGNILLVEERIKVEALARTISLNERLILENRTIHDALFASIRFSAAEEALRRRGLFIKTLELTPPQRVMFRLFQHWWLVRRLNKLGLSTALPKASTKLYASSSAIGMILIESDANSAFINAGRLFQRLWLKATKLGLNLQPITAIPYLAQRVHAGETESLSSQHVTLIQEADEKISEIFGAGGRTIAMLFRVGYDGRPSATSAKAPPEITFT